MNRKAILLVEDNPSDIKLTQKALNKNHIANELIIAEDGQEALDYLFGTGEYAGRDLLNQLALVLLDLKLPKVDGHEVLKIIRSNPQTRRLPVVIMTTSKEENDIAKSYDLGVNSYVHKPVDFNQFVTAIEQLGLYWLILNEIPPEGREINE